MSETSFLRKEWLVKTDSSSSTPYLFKFASSTIDQTCSVLFTDTKSVWTEELTDQQFARRWRQHNPQSPQQFPSQEAEEKWRASILELLGEAHTLGGLNTLSFEVTTTNYSDIAFSLENVNFSWRWETNYVGHKSSAEIISKQLVLPLISANHLLFTSAEPIHDMADSDVEKAVDKIGRTARRSVDTHIKNALSKPRVSTILGRMTAMINSLDRLPAIISSVEEPNLEVPSIPGPPSGDYLVARPSSDKLLLRDVEMIVAPPSRSPMRNSLPPQLSKLSVSPTKASSATESSEEEPEPIGFPVSRAAESSRATPPHAKSPEIPKEGNGATSGDDSSPIRPPKKTRRVERTTSDSDSEAERMAHVTQLKGTASGSGTGRGAPRRGVRQPIKRGGKRF